MGFVVLFQRSWKAVPARNGANLIFQFIIYQTGIKWLSKYTQDFYEHRVFHNFRSLSDYEC